MQKRTEKAGRIPTFSSIVLVSIVAAVLNLAIGAVQLGVVINGLPGTAGLSGNAEIEFAVLCLTAAGGTEA